ncbi:uncharacterized protein LOC129778787 [Toxorhynchites rutilus septentrionalis]|uniref:uncharacterized protein LOC129778787 n=1 Tax=Toxorhynchites rutilus septentrionalis TaxID=329112 RepID=UPI002478F114|nr:uncharacterized protein LOC129778787 [Toxorhynchites rutilus septentrionalis]
MHDLLINVTDEQRLSQVAHSLVDFSLEAPKTIATKKKLSKLLNISETGDELVFGLRSTEILVRQFCLNQITEIEFKSHFPSLSQSLQAALVEVITLRKPEVAQHLKNEINAIDNLLMESFDWDVKWIMGNSSLASRQEQITTLALNCRDKDMRLKTVRCEMDREKLGELIRILEQYSSGEGDK